MMAAWAQSLRKTQQVVILSAFAMRSLAGIVTQTESNYGHTPEAVVFSMDACAARSRVGTAPCKALLRHYGGNLMENWSSGESCPQV
jgi:hypothetical protein